MHAFKCLLLLLLTAAASLSTGAEAAQAPSDVIELGKAYIEAHPEETPAPGRNIVDDYALFFFLGFTQGGGTSSAWKAVIRAAHEQGEARWQQGREVQAHTFAGYGYTRVELTGTWVSAFETSSFQSDSLQCGCWLNFLRGMQSERPKARDMSERQALRVQVVGYLSPKGRYGHLGVYGRELWAESIKVLVD